MITDRTIRVAWAASGLTGFMLIFLTLFDPRLLGLPEFFDPAPIGLAGLFSNYLGELWADKLILVAAVIAILPPGILYHLQWQWRRGVDRNLPNFLRDVANAQYTGMTFIRALEFSAQKDYGPLSTHLRWALSKISWGVPYDEALQLMADRIGTSLVRRAVLFIIETGNVGGNIQETMEAIARHIKELDDLNRERLASMKTNIYIIYIGFVVLIMTAVLVYNTFIVALAAEQFSGAIGAIRPQESLITQIMYLRIYLHTSAIVAFFGGLIAGQMGEDAATNGLKHSVVMMIITLAAFLFFIT
jgi:flagellar protein FlaJ